MYPDYALAYNNRGLVCATIGRMAEAIRDYDKAIELNSDYAEAYENRGIAYARAGRAEEAFRDLTRRSDWTPTTRSALQPRERPAESGRLDDAIRDYARPSLWGRIMPRCTKAAASLTPEAPALPRPCGISTKPSS